MTQIDSQKFDIIFGNDIQLKGKLYDDDTDSKLSVKFIVDCNFQVISNSLLRSCLKLIIAPENQINIERTFDCAATATQQLIIASSSTLVQDEFIQDIDCTINNCQKNCSLIIQMIEPTINSYIAYKDILNRTITVNTLTHKLSKCFNNVEDNIFMSLLKAQAPSKILYSNRSVESLIYELIDSMSCEPATIICSDFLRSSFNLPFVDGVTTYSSPLVDQSEIYILPSIDELGELFLFQDITHTVKQEYAMAVYELRSCERIAAFITDKFVKGRFNG